MCVSIIVNGKEVSTIGELKEAFKGIDEGKDGDDCCLCNVPDLAAQLAKFGWVRFNGLEYEFFDEYDFSENPNGGKCPLCGCLVF